MSHIHRFNHFQLAAIMIACTLTGIGCTLFSAGFAATKLKSPDADSQTSNGNRNSQTMKAKKSKGRPVVHFEIGCRDNAKTSDFYSKLFDWQIHSEGITSTIQTGAKKGIEGHITALGHDPQNYIAFYVEVEDIQTYLDKSKELGGKTLVSAIKIPTGKFAWISDPDGNIVGLLQPKK